MASSAFSSFDNAPAEPETLFHPEVLSKTFEGDPGSIREILEMAIRGVPDRINRIREALDSDEPSKVGWEAHSLKGICLTIGVDALGEDCQELIALSEQGARAPLLPASHRLAERWEIVHGQVQLFLATLPADLGQPA